MLSPAGAIAHAGIAMPNGIPLWIHHGLRPDVAPAIVTNVIALSGLIVTDRGAYERLGGIDAALGELALIDYCLRLAAIGRRSVLVPDVRVSLTAPERPDNDLRLFARLRERWAEDRPQPVLQPVVSDRSSRSQPDGRARLIGDWAPIAA